MKKENIIENVGSRFDIRRSYWAYALKEIKKIHENDGLFYRNNPSKCNWIDCSVVFKGVRLCCVANYDCARVVLWLGDANKQNNKSTFDKLISFRGIIEKKLGAPLSWERNDSCKSSKVFYQLNGVSLENEKDWEQMAKFHAEWSKKFYDVLVPYLK